MGIEFSLGKKQIVERFNLSKGNWSLIFPLNVEFKLRDLYESPKDLAQAFKENLFPSRISDMKYFREIANRVFLWNKEEESIVLICDQDYEDFPHYFKIPVTGDVFAVSNRKRE